MIKVYTNPFSEMLYFDFVSPVNVNARIDILDNNGCLVQTIFDQQVEADVINKVQPSDPSGWLDELFIR